MPSIRNLSFSEGTTVVNPSDTSLQIDGSAYKNWIINGAMEITQRGTSFVSPSNGSYTLDRWVHANSSSATFTVSYDTTYFPTFAQSGYNFNSSLKWEVTGTDTDLSTTQTILCIQRIEGTNYIYLHGKTLTLSFWVRGSVTGTYCVSFRNSDNSRAYVAEYTIDSANTWEQKTITFNTDSSGTWLFTTGIGMSVNFTLGAGTNFATTAGSWQSGAFIKTTNQVNLGATNGATWYLAGVKLNIGSSATSFSTFGGDYGNELFACQRYYCKSYNEGTDPGAVTAAGSMHCIAYSSTNALCSGRFPARMRATPTVTSYNSSGTSGKMRILPGGTAFDCTISNISTLGFGLVTTSGATAGNVFDFQFIASIEL